MVSDLQHAALVARVKKLEDTVSNLLVAINQFVTVNQVHQLTYLSNGRLDVLEERVTGVEARLELDLNDPT
jgi:hypothetical protein